MTNIYEALYLKERNIESQATFKSNFLVIFYYHSIPKKDYSLLHIEVYKPLFFLYKRYSSLKK